MYLTFFAVITIHATTKLKIYEQYCRKKRVAMGNVQVNAPHLKI